MTNLTKKEALEKTIFIWKQIAQLSDKVLSNYTVVECKRLIYSQHDLKNDLHNCPCCEYAKKETIIEEQPIDGYIFETNCNNCPIWNSENFCESGDSPYARILLPELEESFFTQLSHKELAAYKRQCAIDLVKLAESKLAELNKEKSNGNAG